MYNVSSICLFFNKCLYFSTLHGWIPTGQTLYVFKNNSIKLKIIKNYHKPHSIGKNSTFRIITLCTYSSYKLLKSDLNFFYLKSYLSCMIFISIILSTLIQLLQLLSNAKEFCKVLFANSTILYLARYRHRYLVKLRLLGKIYKKQYFLFFM